MGKIITNNNKVKFEVKNKQDCIIYLGHLIEYLEKKTNIYLNISYLSLGYLAHAIEEENTDVELNSSEEILNFINNNKNFELDLDFYKFKLFNSAANEIKNEITNLIGDFSKDKLAISYNNYLDIIKTKKIADVEYKMTEQKKDLIKSFNTARNYTYHFTSDKFCEWIDYRENQVKELGGKFEMGEEFNIYMSDTIPFNTFVEETLRNIAFLQHVNEAREFMMNDFESLIGKKVTLSIIKSNGFDNSVKDITINGFKSHEKSNMRKNIK